VSTVFRRYMPQKEGAERGFGKTIFFGLGFALQNAVMMATMTTAGDVGTAISRTAPRPVSGPRCAYTDLYTGGLGFAGRRTTTP
jgi:hypothetical protein